MPRARLNTDRVVDAATAMADEVGFAQLTLSGLAAELGVRQPSLYKHVDSIEWLRSRIAIRAKEDLAERIARVSVGRSREEAVIAMAHAYRAWAIEHPGSYEAAQRPPDPGDTDDEAATARVLEVIEAVIAGFGLAGGDAIDAIRAFRATVHGFVSLELSGGFALPRSIEHSYAVLVASFVASLSGWPTRTARPRSR